MPHSRIPKPGEDALFVLGFAFLVVLAPSEERPDRATEDVPLATAPARTARHATDERLVAVRDPVVAALLDNRRAAERSREGGGELGIRKRRVEVLRSGSQKSGSGSSSVSRSPDGRSSCLSGFETWIPPRTRPTGPNSRNSRPTSQTRPHSASTRRARNP